MLYSVIQFETPEIGGDPLRDTIPSGKLGVVPVTLGQNQTIVLVMNQLFYDTNNLPQDFALRGWVSTQQGGNPVIDNPASQAQWPITGLQKRVVILYDMMAEAPVIDGIYLPLMPGAYWLNILNLVNEDNSFALEITGG